MAFSREKTKTLFLAVVFGIFTCQCGTPKQVARQTLDHLELGNSTQAQEKRNSDEQAKRVFDHVLENLRYSRYWYETPDIGDGYVEGKQISALIFWTKEARPSKVGFCSPDLERCFATWAGQIRQEMEQMRIDRSLSAKAAFESFVEDGIDANTIKIAPQVIQPSSDKVPPDGSSNPSIPTISSTSTGQDFPLPRRLNLTDFEFVEKTITLPHLGLPASISRREIPKEAEGEAKRIKQSYTCWYEGKRPQGCTGTLVFAYYNESDSTWPVLRTCSSSCLPVFRGDSIQILRRGMDGWEAYGGGGINSPKDEVARLKQKIEQAEMFSFHIP